MTNLVISRTNSSQTRKKKNKIFANGRYTGSLNIVKISLENKEKKIITRDNQEKNGRNGKIQIF